jgi:hypothetical protein
VTKPIDERPVFVVTLRPEKHCLEPVRALRAVLKLALRSHGLRCVEVVERMRVTTPSTAIVLSSSFA